MLLQFPSDVLFLPAVVWLVGRYWGRDGSCSIGLALILVDWPNIRRYFHDGGVWKRVTQVASESDLWTLARQYPKTLIGFHQVGIYACRVCSWHVCQVELLLKMQRVLFPPLSDEFEGKVPNHLTRIKSRANYEFVSTFWDRSPARPRGLQSAAGFHRRYRVYQSPPIWNVWNLGYWQLLWLFSCGGRGFGCLQLPAILISTLGIKAAGAWRSR
jgi:hypothetical protein